MDGQDDAAEFARWKAERQVEAEGRVVIARLAQRIGDRIAFQGLKGKKAEAAAVEMAAGALAACASIYNTGDDTEHKLTRAVSFFAFMVSTRGLAYVKERANCEPEPLT